MNTAETGKVTATVTSGVANSSGATVQPSVEEFLGKVVPWPVNGAGHVNLHYSMLNLRNPGGKDIVTGKPFQSVGDFLKFACWTNTIKRSEERRVGKEGR